VLTLISAVRADFAHGGRKGREFGRRRRRGEGRGGERVNAFYADSRPNIHNFYTLQYLLDQHIVTSADCHLVWKLFDERLTLLLYVATDPHTNRVTESDRDYFHY
jgi:hypothetical protein